MFVQTRIPKKEEGKDKVRQHNFDGQKLDFIRIKKRGIVRRKHTEEENDPKLDNKAKTIAPKMTFLAHLK